MTMLLLVAAVLAAAGVGLLLLGRSGVLRLGRCRSATQAMPLSTLMVWLACFVSGILAILLAILLGVSALLTAPR